MLENFALLKCNKVYFLWSGLLLKQKIVTENVSTKIPGKRKQALKIQSDESKVRSKQYATKLKKKETAP